MTLLALVMRLYATCVVMLLMLTSPPRQRLTIERGSYKQAVVRCFFEDDKGRRACLDSRLMTRGAAVRLAKRIARDGTEVEVVGLKHNCVRPAPWQCHKTKRLDEHRLNRVSSLISAESLFADRIVTMDAEETPDT